MPDKQKPYSVPKNYLFLQDNKKNMHELSIAMQIIEIVKEEAKNHAAIGVSAINLDIGKLSGIEPDALEFAMEEAVKGSMAEKAEVHYNYIQAVSVCEDCCREFEVQDYFKTCPFCNSLNTSLIKGKELKIAAIDLITN
ncbi:MAG: hydrogenase nickel incorporation protein HypA/HybF [Bacteroidales bacterium]|jgi:hydrogenase nickel incorporation protein HypA/HybF|nr:hydrogenase nickel incorporation protein HypA/HybF [Bacteroidales bacterium]